MYARLATIELHPHTLPASNRNKHDSGNDFILPVMPVQESQKQFWEQLKFTLNSCIRA